MTPPAASPPARSLLIVDDSRVQRAHAVALCREIGVPLIHEAGSGAEALAWLATAPAAPDLLIIDLEMPDMDGVELIQQLAGRRSRIPLIVASSRETILIQSVETMARNLGLKVLAGLRKPLEAARLIGALRQIGGEGEVACPPPQPDAADQMCPAALGSAISSGSISVHYQPKVDVQTGFIRGVEALARWRRPVAGFVRPDQFIALAEREGLIHDLTLSVVGQALAQAARWNAHGLKLSMAVNLSPRLLEVPDLVQELAALAAQHGVPCSRIVLEITESSLVDGMGAALGILARLRLLGFGLSIDDYGTGFSSMQQLARLPFTECKIDRSFVHGAHGRTHQRVILRSALDMARKLGLVTVAEGVETLEDWRLLRDFGCDVGQGFLIARPMAASDLPGWLKRHQGRLHDLRFGAVPAPIPAN
jgi:EAL domain-containing protein (putative c-di-GMP-specific phosphodiesterase class I)/ActR/RegA family two-component response regulator